MQVTILMRHNHENLLFSLQRHVPVVVLDHVTVLMIQNCHLIPHVIFLYRLL